MNDSLATMRMVDNKGVGMNINFLLEGEPFLSMHTQICNYLILQDLDAALW
jgi:hypothetical protein